MYLKKTPTKSGRVSLSAVQNFRDESGRNRQRTVKTFGFVDELEAEWPDPIAHFKEVVAAMDAERLATERTATMEVNPLEKVDKNGGQLRRYVGDALACWWLNTLGVETAIRNSMRGRKLDYDLNAALRLIVCERLVNPGSKLDTAENAQRHFFRSELTDDDMRRSLAELDRISGKIIDACNRSIAKNTHRDESLVYYDVTNHFFESDSNVDADELRPSPIVQMGMLQDADGIPISYELFPGNACDCQTPSSVLKSGSEHKTGRVVVVAEKSMGCLDDDIAGCVARGDGFLFSQSLWDTEPNDEWRAWALSDDGYSITSDGEFSIKGMQSSRRVKIKVGDSADDRERTEDVEVKVVFMWSRKYAELERPCLIVTSETNWSDQRIVDAYRELWLIEEFFGVTETEDLYSTPAIVWTPEHIRAHFLTCYLALLIVRLSQRALPSHPAATELLEDMRALSCSYVDDGWWLFDHRTDLTDEIFALVGEEAPYRWMRTKDIKALFAKGKKISWG
ncbi:MAG: hypothetical protein Q4B54_06345 [Coriobacteriales bacterium]|nr:hypothetical protein [Coriobacteriales bacterium]